MAAIYRAIGGLRVTDICISSLMDARKYREQLAARTPENDPAVVKWRVFERCVLMIVLGASFLIYYVIWIHAEILSLPAIYISVPEKVSPIHRVTRGASPWQPAGRRSA